MSTRDIKVDMSPLCYRCCGNGHYAIVCLSKGLDFCVEGPESKLESYSKEKATYNEGHLRQMMGPSVDF